MAENEKDLTGHLLTEIGRIHDTNERIFDKLSEQGETLVRNTVTLEEHVRRTNILEEKNEKIEEDVHQIKLHVNKVQTLIGIFKPTKEKIKWLIVTASLLGGTYGSYDLATEDSAIKQVIEKVLK